MSPSLYSKVSRCLFASLRSCDGITVFKLLRQLRNNQVRGLQDQGGNMLTFCVEPLAGVFLAICNCYIMLWFAPACLGGRRNKRGTILFRCTFVLPQHNRPFIVGFCFFLYFLSRLCIPVGQSSIK